MKKETLLIVQARMGSSRLPGKVLLDLHGKPMLEWVLRRGGQAERVSKTMIATTTDPSDDAIAGWCSHNQVACYRGSVFDVLDRYYQTARQYDCERVVRVTADCPLIDPGLIDQVIALQQRTSADFAANRLPPPWHRTFPIGLDVEAVSFAMLERAWREARLPYEREHVMPWFYNTDGRCRVEILEHDPDYGSYRWTVDTPEDYQLMQRVFELLEDPLRASWLDVLHLFETHPELIRINAGTRAKRVDAVDERSVMEEN